MTRHDQNGHYSNGDPVGALVTVVVVLVLIFIVLKVLGVVF